MNHSRATIAQTANLAARDSRRVFPRLAADSDRQTLIAWLSTNDPNGCYDDEESLAEFDRVMSLAEAWECLDTNLTDYGYFENPWTVGDVAVYVAGPPHRRSDIGSTVTVEHIGSDPSGVPCATIRFSDGYRTAVRACAAHTNIRPVQD